MINGVVAWIDIVHDGAADGVWKAQADSHYLEKEIAEAKAALWKACGEKLGTRTDRQGENKKKKEIDDISDNLRKLKSESNFPLILATSRMIARAPPFGAISESSNITDVVSKVKNLEDCMGAFMKKQSDQMKELTEIVAVNAYQKKPSAPLLRETGNLETPRTKRRRLEDEELSQQPSAPPAKDVLEEQHGPVNGAGSYAGVAAGPAPPHQGGGVKGITPITQARFRKKSVLVYGKATIGKNDTEEILAADVELVATGVAKDASSEQLEEFIVGKGIDVVEITKLTTFEQARTNTFKIKIKAAQYTKAMDPDIWPLRVGVRHYRQPRRDQNTGNSWNDQTNKSGGVINQQRSTQRRYPQQQQYQPQPQGQQQQHYNQQPRYYQQPQGYPQYQQQYQRQPQFPQHGQENLDLNNRFVVDGFATDVYN